MQQVKQNTSEWKHTLYINVGKNIVCKIYAFLGNKTLLCAGQLMWIHRSGLPQVFIMKNLPPPPAIHCLFCPSKLSLHCGTKKKQPYFTVTNEPSGSPPTADSIMPFTIPEYNIGDTQFSLDWFTYRKFCVSFLHIYLWSPHGLSVATNKLNSKLKASLQSYKTHYWCNDNLP
jgi:hypothetical protein